VLHQLATHFIKDTQASLGPFTPELILCITIMAMLLVRACRLGQYVPGFLMAMVGCGTALFFAAPWLYLSGQQAIVRQELFTGMLVFDGLTVFVRAFLLVFALLFAVLTRLTRMPERDDAVDFYCLVLGATLGMCLMASANHLLMVFMAVEMASVPSYALAGQLKSRRRSSEAALNYSIYGAGAAGIMLYGISLLCGVLNSAHLPTMVLQLADKLPAMSPEQKTVLALGALMLMVGLAFKLSAVPFHFWCPDVFEGATAEVDAFLSVASKAAALALLVRVAVGFGHMPAQVGAGDPATASPAAATSSVTPGDARHATVLVAETGDASEAAHGDHAAHGNGIVAGAGSQPADGWTAGYGSGPLAPVRRFISVLVGVIGVVTCTFGNLAAYGQTNIKRLMGYSTIAHAGYMMLAVPAAVATVDSHPAVAQGAVSALLLYGVTYLLMNLAAFAIIAFLRNSLGSEEIADYSGLVRRAPLLVLMFVAILFSLVGLPPLAGFVGKFAIFASLADAWQTAKNPLMLVLLVLGGLNTVLSLFYYLRVAKVMTIDAEKDDAAGAGSADVPWLGAAFVAALVVPILTLIVYADSIAKWTNEATKSLF